ncbi:MAG: GNAT family N-acetyltransferase [Devosia sp.]
MSEAPTILIVPLFSQLGNLGLALRREVFIREQKVPEEDEFDSYDLTATHVVAVTGGNVAGVLRILFLPEHVKIGRVAVGRDWRGQGIASAMMRFAMEHARGRGEMRFYLTAQIDKLTLYEKLGYVAFGEPFQDGGMPHLAMKTY